MTKLEPKYICTSKGVRKDMTRRTAREKALQALYQIDLIKSSPKEAIESVLVDGEHESEMKFLENLVFGCTEKINDVDDLIRPYLKKWTLERLGIIDRNIMRMAVYEMKYIEDIPPNVSINEAIEIAKVFGDDHSTKFVNGVLSKVKETLN